MNKYIRICILLQQKKTRSSLTRRYKQGCTQYKRHRRLVEQAGNQYSTHFPIFARFHSDPLLSRGAIDQCRPAETRANPATTITQCVPPSVRRATRIQPRVRRECGAFAPPPRRAAPSRTPAFRKSLSRIFPVVGYLTLTQTLTSYYSRLADRGLMSLLPLANKLRISTAGKSGDN